MRVLFASTGNLGHFLPQVPLARALVDAGHEVRVAVPASFAHQVAAAGLAPEPFGEPAPEAVGHVLSGLAGLSAAEADRVVVREVFGRLDAGAALAGLLATLRTWRPHLVVREPAELASLAAAEARGVRHVVSAIGLDSVVRGLAPALADPLSELGGRVGVGVAPLLEAMARAPVFTTRPATFDDVADTSRRLERYHAELIDQDAPVLPRWGEPRAPLVYASLGSVAGTMPGTGALLGSILAALAPLTARVLLTVGHAVDPDTLRPWPENAHVVRWWPQPAVMPHAALVVGHGGFGTTATALAAGVPQVVVPLFASDQWANARRVDQMGIGVLVEPGDGLVGRLAAAARRVLDGPAFPAAAGTLADEMAGLPPASAMVPRLLAHT